MTGIVGGIPSVVWRRLCDFIPLLPSLCIIVPFIQLFLVEWPNLFIILNSSIYIVKDIDSIGQCIDG